ncbi:MAG: hypothetical protein WAO52_11230 [Prolixibacteraceae bacterium]
MNIRFDHNYSGILIILAVLFAAGISYFLYFRNKENLSLSNVQKGFLAVLRFLSLSIILFFLFSPLIEHVKNLRQLPILAIAFDNSLSVQADSTAFYQFEKSVKERFSDDYQLDFWSFGEKVEKNEKFTGKERRSDYGQLLKSLNNHYINKNIGAVILLGDGIYNQGQNPENLSSGLNFPVYSLGIGDTSNTADAAIRNVRTNKTAFLKNKFPVEIEFKFNKLKNKIAYFDIENNHKQVYSGNISITADDDFKLEFLNLEATNAGLQHYRIRIKTLDGEENLKNNEFEFVIRILENKQKILIVSDGPHPDLGAIRNSLDELQNYEIRTCTGFDVPDSLTSYSLIILNQLPSVKNTSSKLLSKLKESRLPLLFLIGPNTLLDQFNALNLGLNISNSKNFEEVQGVFNSNFSLFVLSGEAKSLLELAPPLLAPFGNTATSPLIQNLALQNIRNIPTNKTFLALGTDHGRKTGFITGEGLWRWRLFDYKESGNHDAFNEFIQKSIQYLVLKENEDNFNVYCPSQFQETDEVEITAELYNDSYELINSPEVSIRIKNDSLQEFNYLFDRINDFYRLNTGNMKPGNYSFQAETTLGNQNFTESGTFSVIRNEIETQNKKADFNVLYKLSRQSGGQFYYFENYGTLLDSIQTNEKIAVQHFHQTTETEWINLKIIFFLLILSLGAEWFFRKYWGIY